MTARGVAIVAVIAVLAYAAYYAFTNQASSALGIAFDGLDPTNDDGLKGPSAERDF